jgi:flagellar motor switch protein FliG
MAREADRKYRQMAVVLQSMDGATARQLLSQFPPPIAQEIRRSLANLGQVSSQERDEAHYELQNLLGLGRPNPSPSPARPSNPTRSAPARSALSRSSQLRSSGAGASLAAQVLAQQGEPRDSFQVSDAATYSASHYDSSNASNSVEDSFEVSQSPARDPWLQLPAPSIAALLGSERPIVVATVINHLPAAQATAVLQRLPIELASAVLAALPNLQSTDPSVLEEILQEMRARGEREVDAMRHKAMSLDKLRAIVECIPPDQRTAWAAAIRRHDPLLTNQLGIAGEEWVDNQKLPDVFSIPGAALPTLSVDGLSSDSFPSGSRAGQPSSIAHPTSDESVSIPLAASGASEESHQRAEATYRSWSDLLTLQDRDLVRVLQAARPQTVLLAMASADPVVMQRFERLVPRRDLSRFRSRLRELTDVSLREIDAACEEIFSAASRMEQLGQLPSPRRNALASAA